MDGAEAGSFESRKAGGGSRSGISSSKKLMVRVLRGALVVTDLAPVLAWTNKGFLL